MKGPSPSIPSEPYYRIAYETFSSFSTQLNRSQTFDEVFSCLSENLKYLFSYEVFRVSFHAESDWFHFCGRKDGHYEFSTSEASLLQHEKELFENHLPKVWDGQQAKDIAEQLGCVQSDPLEVWSWYFNVAHAKGIAITLITDPSNSIVRKDLKIIRLVAETLEAKLLELNLFNRLKSKQKLIATLLDQQDAIIQNQTRELKTKNDKLSALIKTNAHNVREPLTRILGIIEMLEDSPTEVIEESLPFLKTSASDLDTAVKEAIEVAEAESPPS